MLIDSLTEEEALALLRSESEMYALQMAQAAKLGISMNEIKSYEAATQISASPEPPPTVTSPLSVEEAVTSAISTVSIEEDALTSSKDDYDDISDSNNNDIFENVFNYDDQFECELELEEPNEQGTTVTESFYYNDSAMITNATSGCSSAASPTYFNSNISVSLRNSLLKLRHSRRHLATLIETNKNSSTSTSSTTSSFTTNSSMSLYKQHMLNMQQQSKKPCVYMLNEGRCARADCRFVHDLKTITCKYWLEGECLKGENCEFAHEYIEESEQVSTSCSRRNHKSSFSSSHSSHKQSKKQLQSDKEKEKAALKLKKIDFKLDTEEFPALGGGPTQQSNSEPKIKQVVVSSPPPPAPPPPPPTTTSIKNASVKELPSVVPAKTAASILFSNVTKTVTKSQTENRNAVNIVPNKQQQQQNTTSSKSVTKNSKQTGIKLSDSTQQQQQQQHKSRDHKATALNSSKNSRPNSKKSHK